MFGDLFYDVDEGNNNSTNKRKEIPLIRQPRGPTGFCGITNLGATCYLNALLQTLFLTPEFRRSILSIDRNELGDTDQATQVRSIPIQLRKLFARMLQLNIDFVDTDKLIESFGWSSDETFLQQDIQELNRVLFDAMEQSLIGTSSDNIIRDLYKGTTVNEIECKECKIISRREEGFLDLSLSVADSSTLDGALSRYFLGYELMCGDNKYYCEGCVKHVDAEKRCRLLQIPPILTISLLRFYYDSRIGNYKKDKKRFSFPKKLNMNSLCKTLDKESIYELYSVIIHRGELSGGHYHCFIKDINNLGKWSLEKIPTDTSENKDSNPTSKIDFMDLFDPLQILIAIVDCMGRIDIPIDVIGQKLTKETGSSWNNRYRRKYGPIRKFLGNHSDIFMINDDLVSLLSAVNVNKKEIQNDSSKETENNRDQSDVEEISELTDNQHLSDEQHWFDFDDLSVTPILYNEIDKKYSGGESAYMLFYRLQSDDSLTCKNDVIEEIPKYLINEINIENAKLQEDRDTALYKHYVTAYHHKDFMYNDGLLIPIKEDINLEELAVALQVDDREGIEGVKRKILDSFQHYSNDHYYDIVKSNLYMARPFERYLHIYQTLDNNIDAEHFGISDNDIIVYSEDKLIEIMDINEHHRPILLKCMISCITASSNRIFDIKAFSSMKLSTLYDLIIENIGVMKEDLCIVKNANICPQVELLFLLQDLRNNDETMENKNFASVEELYITDLLTMQENGQLNSNHFYCIVKNIIRHNNQDHDTSEIIVMQTNLDVIVSEIKAIAASRFGVNDLQECRLKAFDGTILQDYLNLRKCGLEGNQAAVLLEKGQPITEVSNILLTYDTPSNTTRGGNREIIIDYHSSVKKCISKMMQLSNLKEGNYHLMKSSLWFDSFAVIHDLEKSLYQLHIEHGDHLILQEGQLLPEGFVKINIKIFVPLEQKMDDFYNCDVSLTQCLLNDMQAEYLKFKYVILSTCVEIALDSILQELKMQLLTMPEASRLSLSSINHLRIYHQRGNKCNLLKGDTKLIKNLNIEHRSTICMQALFLEETLSVDTTLLFIRHRISERREYGPAIEIACDSDDLRNSDSLKKRIRYILGINSPQELIIAKYNQQQFEWIVINESKGASSNQGNKVRKNRKGKKNRQKCLLDPPYNICDGNVIGLKILVNGNDDDDDFSTIEDDDGKAKLRLIEEEENRRKANSNTAGIKIRVDIQ